MKKKNKYFKTKTIVYLIHLKDLGVLKVGISSNMKVRLDYLRKQIRRYTNSRPDIEVLSYISFHDREAALAFERGCSEKLNKYSTTPITDFAGKTECYSLDAEEKILKLFDNSKSFVTLNPFLYLKPDWESVDVVRSLILSHRSYKKRKSSIRGLDYLTGCLLANLKLNPSVSGFYLGSKSFPPPTKVSLRVSLQKSFLNISELKGLGADSYKHSDITLCKKHLLQTRHPKFSKLEKDRIKYLLEEAEQVAQKNCIIEEEE